MITTRAQELAHELASRIEGEVRFERGSRALYSTDASDYRARAAVFRDELVNLFPNDENARRLAAQTYLLSEFLQKQVESYDPPRLAGAALVHVHCHHRAIIGVADEQAVLDRVGLDYRVQDSGCCGMAGAFGFERDHYDISMGIGERVLLPAVRATDEDTIVIADGFSCREQILQATGRRPLHLAEVLQMAMRGLSPGVMQEEHQAAPGTGSRRAEVAVTVAATLAGLAVLASRRRL